MASKLLAFLALALVWAVQSSSPEHGVEAVEVSDSGQLVLQEDGLPILVYNYRTVDPGPVLSEVSESNLKYARARSDYIHPLYGLEGEELTRDWAVDHPHHRGIYWAWPEVGWQGELGDLHALQRVFARPTGRYLLTSGSEFGQIEAENLWLWEDSEAIVRETAILRAWASEGGERRVDLEFHFVAVREGVTLARRDMDKYGGLNIRLAGMTGQKITFQNDSVESGPRMAWGEISGFFSGSRFRTGISIFQHSQNPSYPGDWMEYPDLSWLQPTFPQAGSRYRLKKGEALVLRYRLWIHRESFNGDDHRAEWKRFDQASDFGTAGIQESRH